jgi:hypothetical protein
MGITNHIDQLKKEQTKAQRELDFITELRQEFPDLEAHTDRWRRVRYMAKSANARVNEVMFHRNCGCCADSPVHARPYIKLSNGTYVYSNPCDVMIGEPYSWGDGFREYEGWEEKYVEAEINPAAIETIRQYVARESEMEDEDDDDDDD